MIEANSCINRIRLEFKASKTATESSAALGINRIRLEFKDNQRTEPDRSRIPY